MAERARGKVLLLLLKLEDARLDAILDNETRHNDRAVLSQAVDPCIFSQSRTMESVPAS